MSDSETDLFQYTSGRWLWNEEQQLKKRYTPFNVLELKRIAAHSIGAGTCTAIIKLAEGNYNKCFRLEMDNGSAVIARIPHPNAGPRYYTTASEVATMDFVRHHKCYRMCDLSNMQSRLERFSEYRHPVCMLGMPTRITPSVLSTSSWRKHQVPWCKKCGKIFPSMTKWTSRTSSLSYRPSCFKYP